MVASNQSEGYAMRARFCSVLLVCWATTGILAGATRSADEPDRPDRDQAVQVQVFEGIKIQRPWEHEEDPTATWEQPAFTWSDLPRKYVPGGLIADRSNPFLLQGTAQIEFAAGEYEFLLRAKNLARLTVDGQVVLQQEQTLPRNADGHEQVPPLPSPIRPGHYPPPSIHHELTARVVLSGGRHEVRVESVVGGPGLRTRSWPAVRRCGHC